MAATSVLAAGNGAGPYGSEVTAEAAMVGSVPGALHVDGSTSSADLERDDGFRKDANEVLMKDGSDALRYLIMDAEPEPITGLYRFRDYREQIYKYYTQPDDADLGMSTGWDCLDPYYKVIPGELTIVTGVPNSGKSEWLDALLTNLAMAYGWCFALCSLEKSPRNHGKQLLEKLIGKPFHNYGDASLPRMTKAEVERGLEWLQDHFHVIRNTSDEPPSVEWVLETARMAVLRYGIRGLVIDPYNELDHSRPPYMSETEYVSFMLSKIKRFAQSYGVHVWFVAHPRQMQAWNGQPPTLYDISGSANFINKADNGIVVHREWNINKKLLHSDPQKGDGGKSGGGKGWGSKKDQTTLQPHEVQILLRKVRNKAAGQIGGVILHYQRSSGRYLDPGMQQQPWDISPVGGGANNMQPLPIEAYAQHSSRGNGGAALSGRSQSAAQYGAHEQHAAFTEAFAQIVTKEYINAPAQGAIPTYDEEIEEDESEDDEDYEVFRKPREVVDYDNSLQHDFS